MKREIKILDESMELFKDRADIVDDYDVQKFTLETFLPKQVDEGDYEAIVDTFVATTIRDMGKVIGA